MKSALIGPAMRAGGRRLTKAVAAAASSLPRVSAHGRLKRSQLSRRSLPLQPEELLVASLSACHMLWYLHLCSAHHATVLDCHDAASGVRRQNQDGSGEFVRVTLRPAVKASAGEDRAQALALHHDAHDLCFIARSVNFPVDVAPEMVQATVAAV